jgi:hypothetical protein
LLETAQTWQGPQKDDPFFSGAPGGFSIPGLVLPDKFWQNSVFHPKDLLHKKTANSLMANILKDVFGCNFKTKRAASCPVGGPTIVIGPGSFSVGLPAGGGGATVNFPVNCVAAKPIDNTVPTVFCLDGSTPGS